MQALLAFFQYTNYQSQIQTQLESPQIPSTSTQAEHHYNTVCAKGEPTKPYYVILNNGYVLE